jgi:hypothetical protein
MPKRSSKRPKDTNQLAKSIVDIATAGDATVLPNENINLAAAALGRLGGLKGGKARSESLTPKQRQAIAQKAARSRWGKK